MILRTLLLMLACGVSHADTQLITDVNVLPMTDDEALDGRDVLIVDGRIEKIARSIRDVPEDAQRIDGSGKYLMPGLWDMHVHLSGNADTALPMFLANGVTGVRDMGGDPNDLFPVRDAVASGERIGPRILTAGPILESPRFVERMQNRDIEENPLETRIGVGSAEEANTAIAKLKEMGADFAKIRTVENKDTYWAISKEAEAAGLKLYGHADLPFRFLMDGMQASFEHLPNDTLRRSDEAERRAIWKELAKRGTAIVPTTVNYTHSIFLPMDEIERSVEDTSGAVDARNRLVSAALRGSWREQVIDRKESRHPDYPTIFETWFSHLREAHEEGVKILPGTDDGVVLMYSGYSLHDELAVLVEHLRVDPVEILRNATIESARLLGLGEELGTVEEGKLADLVLLNKNPLENIANSRSIAGVFRVGAYYDSGALRRLLDQVAETAAS